MPEKKKSYVKFEGIIVPSSSGEGLAETDKAWLVEIEIPNKYSGEQVWIAKSMVKPGLSIKNGDLIQGSVESWIFKKLDKKETTEEKIEILEKQDIVDLDSVQVEVITPSKEEMKKQYEGFVGDIPKKGMQFKEISVSLGEKVSADFQSKNVQIGAVIILGGYSVDLAYTTARNYVIQKVKEEVKRIREEML